MCNFISTQAMNKLKEVTLITKSTKVRDVAEMYKELNEAKKLIDAKMKSLAEFLIEKEVNELFPEDNIKVIYEVGRDKTELDNEKIFKEVGKEMYLKISSVSETSINNNLNKDLAKRLIATSKIFLEEKTKPCIKVTSLSKDDLEKLQGITKLPKGVM
ncbi:MAG: hypothetical protein ABSG25_01515 [Bryobacteraceae bacterium]